MSFSKYILLLLLIVCVEAFVILFVMNQASQGVLGGDGPFYHDTAIGLLDYSFDVKLGDRPRALTMQKTPGYSLFVAAIYAATGESFTALRIAQYLLFWLVGVGIYLLARYFVDERASKIAGLLCATCLPLVFYPIYHLSEIAATFLVVWSVYYTVKWRADDSWTAAIASGLFFAILVLVRPNWALLVVPLLALVCLKLKTKALPKIAVFGLIGFLIVAPWLIRNYRLTGKWMLNSVSNQTLNASARQYAGKTSYAFTTPEWEEFLADLRRRNEEIDRQTAAQVPPATVIEKELLLEESYKTDLRAELKELSAAQVIKSLPKRIAYLWSPSDLAPPDIYNNFYHRLSQAYYLLAAILILYGLYLRKNHLKEDWILLAPAVYITLIHLVFHVESRYSIPARPFLMIFAAVGINGIKNVLSSKF
jgi:4-amino-4-deoxy-L-arabinose transferase-like glycosyltransferase